MTNKEVGDEAVSHPAEVPISSEAQAPEILDLFDFLSKNEKIVFKSQQIGDPELTINEKKDIAQEIYIKSRHTFLMRFGSFFEEHHLNNFAKLSFGDESSDEQFADLKYLISAFHQKLKTRNQLVKNRRYMALKDLIEKGEYFCETEMMKRSPELYHELIGQYMSDIEKKMRDSYDVKKTTFSGILLHTFEQRERNEMMEATKAAMASDSDDDDEEENNQLPNLQIMQICDSYVEDDCFSDDTPVSFKQQWGNFDNEQIPCSTSKVKPLKGLSKKSKSPISKSRRDKFITPGERDLLRHEFVKIMHTNFLSGADGDFDYREVDDNAEFDDLKQISQDKEDEYFNESEENSVEVENEQMCESEDELDIFMEHLSKHPSLQDQNNLSLVDISPVNSK